MDQHKFITIISDGSTDISVMENEIVYCRSAYHGEIYTYFCGLKSASKANSDGIYHACTESLTESLGPSSLTKVVAIAADGATVNTGKFDD